MEIQTKIKTIIVGLILFSSFSCQTTVHRRKMDHFVPGTLQKIVKNAYSYGLVIKNDKDSLIYATAFLKDEKHFAVKLEDLKVGQRIAIRGIILTDYDKKTGKANHSLITVKKLRLLDGL